MGNNSGFSIKKQYYRCQNQNFSRVTFFLKLLLSNDISIHKF
ncbi:hypothetical protein AM1_G0016 (plasmid) [Acaryochloris marina MBIC11017]|uniref:Uncharacterized protein n=1 Tax=Acaryochloris marina (strain MBIC 11017) TaxID=329726 RepID=A8ZQB0_ACAM1|nr:hypothetical protein AM1_G0016 [Acaryochloris marina MBIC11017]